MNCVLVSTRLYQSLADNYTSLVLYICILNKNQGTQLLLNSWNKWKSCLYWLGVNILYNKLQA